MTLEELHTRTIADGWQVRVQQAGGAVVAWLRQANAGPRTAREFVAQGSTLADALARAIQFKDEATQ